MSNIRNAYPRCITVRNRIWEHACALASSCLGKYLWSVQTVFFLPPERDAADLDVIYLSPINSITENSLAEVQAKYASHSVRKFISETKRAIK